MTVDQSPEDRVAAVERGLAALTERVERLEGEVLPRDVAGDPTACRYPGCENAVTTHLITAFGSGNFCAAHSAELRPRIDIVDRALPIGTASAHPPWVRESFRSRPSDPVPA